VVVVVRVPVDSAPEVAPVKLGTAVFPSAPGETQDEAFVELHLSVVDEPDVIEVESAVRVAVGEAVMVIGRLTGGLVSA
jgi:hypothetical protein